MVVNGLPTMPEDWMEMAGKKEKMVSLTPVFFGQACVRIKAEPCWARVSEISALTQ